MAEIDMVNCAVEFGEGRVAYRETIAEPADGLPYRRG